jgi:hypothetical protein
VNVNHMKVKLWIFFLVISGVHNLFGLFYEARSEMRTVADVP